MSFRRSVFRGLFALVVAWLACMPCASWPAAAGEDEPTLREFMRKKLESSSIILEGMTTEDARLIRRGAKELLEMSLAEKWNVLTDEDYREFNREFRAAVRKLDEAAGRENFDNAALQWFDAVKGCIECHKYVRSQRPVRTN